MNKRLLPMVLLALLLPFCRALAADGETRNPDPDAPRRAALRLCELGYLTAPPDLASEPMLDAALAAFYEQNALSGGEAVPEKLFLSDALPAPFAGGGIPLPNTPLVTGEALPWAEVQARIAAGDACSVTDCGAGIVCRLVCDRKGENRLVMRSQRDWDAETLAGLLGKNNSLSKRPVILSLSGKSVAACLSAEPVSTPGATPLFRLSFTGGSGLNGIEDVDCAALLRYAAGE